MDVFATIHDVEAGWRVLTDAESERASVLLERASARIIKAFRDAGAEYDLGDEVQATLLCDVCCNMVRRVVASNNDYGYSSVSQTAGSYSEQFTYANPSGDMELTEREKSLLGLKGARIGTIRPKIGGVSW